MKTNISLLISIFALFSLTNSSCSNDGDTTPPTINLISPAEGAILQIGNEKGIHFEVELSDNDMLASYAVEIHDNFDNHPHSKAESSEKTVNFSFHKSWDVSGLRNTTVHHHEIVIPANTTPGKYHLLVYCTDASGNQSYIARNITLSNEVEDENHH